LTSAAPVPLAALTDALAADELVERVEVPVLVPVLVRVAVTVAVPVVVVLLAAAIWFLTVSLKVLVMPLRVKMAEKERDGSAPTLRVVEEMRMK